MSLNGKITLFVILICLITGIIVSSYSFFLSESYLLQSKILEEENNIKIFAESVRTNLDELENDVRFLASTPPVEGILRANDNNGIDPVDNSTGALWKNRLSIIFREMLYAKERYIQIRYVGIENGGDEILRVERKKLKVFREKDINLQNKINESYYKGVLQTDPGNVYFSEFSLNREFGKIVHPLQMVIRAAYPIYRNHKEPFGFVIINENYNSIFSGINVFSEKGVEFFILNKDREVLVNSTTKDDSIAKFTDKSENLETSNLAQKKIADLNEKLTWGKTETNIADIAKDGEFYYLKKKIFYNPTNPNQYLTIFMRLDKAFLKERIEADLVRTGLLLLFLLGFAVGIAFIFSKRLVAPIKKLMDITQNISVGGKIDFSELHVNSSDEIGTLTNTMLKLSKDILSKNHQLESQKNALDSFAIVAETDLRGKITYVNNKFIEISKFSKAELIGQDHRIINSGYHPKEFFEKMWRTITSGHVWRGEVKNKAKDGTYYWVDTTIFPILDEHNKLNKYVAIRYDVTERKQFEDDLVLAAETTQKAIEVKSTFLANMSHEIRTPLNGILGFTSLLMDQELKDEAREQVEYIKSCSEGLLTIINDILDISKMEAGKFHIENTEMNLRDEVETSLRIFDTTSSRKNVSILTNIDSNVPLWVEGDPTRTRQLLVNLIGNALKFSFEGGVIDLQISCERRSNDECKLLFSIKDNGIGISKDAQERLFSSFEQADISTTRKFGGTGLGLSICKKLTQLMGGDIWVESSLGEGATFYFSILTKELEKSEKSPEAGVELAGETQFDFNVLVVDDNQLNQKIAIGFLKKFGITNIQTAVDGRRALEVLKENPEINLVFMDIQMPVMDGLDATKAIRNELKLDIPIIGLSANAFEEDRMKAIENGMNGYLAKPVDKAKLYECLASLAGRDEIKKAS